VSINRKSGVAHTYLLAVSGQLGYNLFREVFKMVTQTFTAVIHKEEDIYVAECPEVGTVSQGYTIEEAVANLKEATELYLEEFPGPTC
jgi:hypothetical protein